MVIIFKGGFYIPDNGDLVKFVVSNTHNSSGDSTKGTVSIRKLGCNDAALLLKTGIVTEVTAYYEELIATYKAKYSANGEIYSDTKID